MITETIKNFHKQFEYEPEIENAEKLRRFDKFIVVGLGGSHLAADLLKVLEEKVAAREDIKAGRRRDTRWANSTPVEEEIERFQGQIRILKETAGL